MKIKQFIYSTTILPLVINALGGILFPNISIAKEFKDRRPNININKTDSTLFWHAKPPFQIARQNYRGRASWYGKKFHGRPTASGEIFNSNALTAAHRTLPFGTKVKVINTRNGKSVVVRINDRGPFIKGRIIDVSAGAARKLNMIDSGTAIVKLEILGR